MFFNWDSLFTGNHSHFNMHQCPPMPPPQPCLENASWRSQGISHCPELLALLRLSSQVSGSQLPDSPKWSPSQLDPHMLGGMWMLAKVTSIRGLKKKMKIHSLPVHPFQRLLCQELSSSEQSQVGGESCFLQRPLHKCETCLLSFGLLWWVSPGSTNLLSARQNSVFEKVKVCWFSIKSFSNSDDF